MKSPISDEVDRPQDELDSAGQGLLERAFARENLKRAWKRVKANKGAAGVDGLDIEQTAKHLLSRWPTIREQLISGAERPMKAAPYADRATVEKRLFSPLALSIGGFRVR